jgi:hypothetical protein
VGAGGRGEITEKIQTFFFDVTKGERKAPGDWLTYVRQSKSSKPSNNGSKPEKGSDVSTPSSELAEPAMKYQTAARSID